MSATRIVTMARRFAKAGQIGQQVLDHVAVPAETANVQGRRF
jgi:hypothetical protein